MWQHTKRAFVALSVLLIAGLAIGFVIGQSHGGKLLSVQSGSMLPKIKKGDLVVVNRIPASQLVVGDVITFINPNNKKQTVTHRVVTLPSSTNGGKITTKGDANTSPDEPIDTIAIIGRMRYSVPYVGYGLDFVHNPLGLIFLIYIPAIAVIIDEIRRLSRYYKSQEKYELYRGYSRKHTHPKKNSLVFAGKSTALVVLVSLLLVVPTRAALLTHATLAGNTISTTALGNSPYKLLFKEVNLRCSSDNTVSANKRPKIIIYNPTNQNITANGWHINDNFGTIVSIPNGTVIKKNHKYTFSPWLVNGLQYVGDRLVLYDGNNLPIDGISWGSDTTLLNPALQNIAAGTKLKRDKPKLDTNTAEDWKIDQHHCNHQHDDDHESGDDDEDCGDKSEPDRTQSLGWFHMWEDDD